MDSASSGGSSRPSNVLVAVRVRPFNERERERNARLVVRMEGGRVTELRDPKGREAPRRFTFDHSYWSHDGFCAQQNGYLAPASADYADQKRVFDDFGVQVLRNAWAGYNCALFAYGQTGSGKSYSVVGFGPNRGLLPMLCDELFRGIERRGEKAECQVSLSMVEIYCEKVRDLLAAKSSSGGLKMREHPKNGFYVEGLTTRPVHSARELERTIADGTRARSIAATNLNETSSRAHTIVRLVFEQKTSSSTKVSEINLVDLAGSERLKQSRSEGERQREGIRINQSLSALGRVIKALHERQSGQRNVQVPYRDSVLTSLLRNALGGNSKTIMIATISPADAHFEETLSTLRFADRVKAIQTAPVVNESASEKLVRTLREENARLLETLGRGALEGVATEDELEALRRQLAHNQREIEKLERSWAQREEALRKQLSSLSLDEEVPSAERRKDTPHLWNLNEDPALSNVIVHLVDKGETRVGNAAEGQKPHIQLKGLGPGQAVLRNRDNKQVTLRALDGAEVLVNGQRIGAEDERELAQNDRIHFGGNHLYVFVNPLKGGALPPERMTFDVAQKEIAAHSLRANLQLDGRKKSKEELMLEEELVNLLPYVYRANSMAKELRREVHFEIVLLPPEARGTERGVTEVWVKVHNKAEDNTFLWDSSRFMSRYHRMQEMYQSYLEGETEPSDVPRENDPFHEPANSAVHLGTATVFLQSLAYLVELDEQVPILDVKGAEVGKLALSVTPCEGSDHREIVGECVERSEELLGKNLAFKVKILSAIGLPQRTEQSCCKYRFFDQEQISTRFSNGSNPLYAHERLFPYRPITKQLIDYLEEGALIIDVLGTQRARQNAKREVQYDYHEASTANGQIADGSNNRPKEPTKKTVANGSGIGKDARERSMQRYAVAPVIGGKASDINKRTSERRTACGERKLAARGGAVTLRSNAQEQAKKKSMGSRIGEGTTTSRRGEWNVPKENNQQKGGKQTSTLRH